MTVRRAPMPASASASDWPFLEAARPQTGLWERLKEAIEQLVFEDEDRPIGMTQLSRNTFTPAPSNADSVFFRNAPTFCDYGFIKRYQEPSAHGTEQRPRVPSPAAR